MGPCNTETAETWALLLGLQLAWTEGYRKIILEIDSRLALSLIRRNHGPKGPSNPIIKKCSEFLAQDWEVNVCHIYREMNEVADGISKWVVKRDVGFHMLDNPPGCVTKAIQKDNQGIGRYRWVNHN